MKHPDSSKISGISVAGLLVTLGIVFGDIGTSPLYVMKAIAGGNSHLDENFILGVLSCVIWTLTLQTTVKYVLITLKADNNGEGGIFSLFALIRKHAKWAYIFAIIGGSALLADGIITPAMTVLSAVEGLEIINPNISVIPIVLIIISLLFLVQQFGTKLLGSSFGPIMLVWFLMLAFFGFAQTWQYPEVLKSFNPYYAYLFLFKYPGGFLLLGAVFLCTTGAEALYSDLGHCGLKNIRISWFFVKASLILNYLGQGAWILRKGFHDGDNPFFDMMPTMLLIPGIIIATAAAIIASQALITGSFTLISEAVSLNVWPKMKKSYPTPIKGQVYIPVINWFLYVCVVFVVLYFRESTKMEAAYGLSITITMLMTTSLLVLYMLFRKVSHFLIISYLGIYVLIEGAFLVANLHKFPYGGWFTIMLAGIFFIVMYGWHNARKVRNRFLVFHKLEDYVPIIEDLSTDKSVPKFASHLVFITKANRKKEVESKILFSILNKHPKRADVYWLLHINIVDEPYTFEYEVTHLSPGKIIKIDFHLGFKVDPKINLYFRQVLGEMEMRDEIDLKSSYSSLRNFNIDADFSFVLIDRIPNFDYDFNTHDKFVMALYKFSGLLEVNEIKAYGLDTSNVFVEKVPLMVERKFKRKITRVTSRFRI